MSAEIEEVVAHAHVREPEQFAPDRRNHEFQRIPGGT